MVPLWFTKVVASGGATISIADIRTAIVDQVLVVPQLPTISK
jgi:hypothetical protein